jgi:hypothetical protein
MRMAVVGVCVPRWRKVCLRGVVAVPFLEVRMKYISTVNETWKFVLMLSDWEGVSGGRSRQDIFGGWS